MLKGIQQRAPAWLVLAAVCLLLAGSAVVPVGPASAQSMVMDVGVDLPDYVILWYWDQITIEITAAELAAHLFGATPGDAGSQSAIASFVGSRLTFDAGIDNVVDDGIVNGVRDPLWLSVPDAWAIESVSASGDTQVSIKIKKRKKDAKLPGPGKNKITLDQIQVEAAGSIGDKIVVPSTGSGGRLWGSIHLRVDIQKAKRAGLYSGIEVEIKAENI